MLIQLIYVSAAVTPFSSEDLAALLAKSRRNNREHHVTGMLLYHEGSFIQVLEGEPIDVFSIFMKIEQDSRHENIAVLLQTSVKQPTFPDWSMGFINADQYADFDSLELNGVFAKSFLPQMFAENAPLAKKLLLAFRDGEWRQRVETGEPQLVGN